MLETNKADHINTSILKQCREQMNISLEEVKRKTKIKKFEEIEAGTKKPTYKQIEELADMYLVPSWVFVANNLPSEYVFNKRFLSFRKLASYSSFNNYKIRKLVGKVEHFRELILELREDIAEPIVNFSPPRIIQWDISLSASNVREWLDVGEYEPFDFVNWREKLENKNIFVFMTSRYQNWSKFNVEEFRGFSLFYEKLPIIVINDSDTKKAQSFTLFHELGHILKKQTGIDIDPDGNFYSDNDSEEQWCNELAGNILMPKKQVLNTIDEQNITNDAIKKWSERIKVSPDAYIVRLRQLNKINNQTYKKIKSQFVEEYEKIKQRQFTGLRRTRHKEIFHEFGGLYSRAVWQAYHNQDINLHHLCRLLGLKQTKHAFDMEHLL